MIVKVASSGKGSSRGLVQYLEKQQRGEWFGPERAELEAGEVVDHLDANRKNLGQQDDKFYQLVLCPSEPELAHIGPDPAPLQAYTRQVMEQYAANFGKGINSQDLVWYAKIEQERTYSHRDRSVQLGEQNKGEKKEGPQTHVHILVSRTENLDRYQVRKQAGELDRKNPLKLSPATNHRDTGQGAVKGGFDRKAFKEAVERQFDQQFTYQRPLSQTFRYANALQHGEPAERLALRQQARQEEQRLHRASDHRQSTGLGL